MGRLAPVGKAYDGEIRMSKRLPDRPRGVRCHWKREHALEANLSEVDTLLGAILAEYDFGENMIEARVFSYRKRLRKVVALFDSGWIVSRAWNKYGASTGWSARKSHERAVHD